MLNRIFHKVKYTMRFSILFIFITLFVTSILSIAGFSYLRFSKTISRVAIQFMEQASTTLFEKISNEINDVTIEAKFFVNLFQLGILDSNQLQLIQNYAVNLMTTESRTLPSLESIYWGDEIGNFIMVRKGENDQVNVQSIDHRQSYPIKKMIYYDAKANILKETNLNKFDYDPRSRPWYQEAKEKRNLVWLDIYRYSLTGFLGTTAAIPVYKPNGDLTGVFSLNLRLDYLRHFIEKLKVSSNGIVYIVTHQGNVVAFPNLSQYQKNSLMDIHQLSNPSIIQSFEYYMQTHSNNFIFRYHGKKYLAVYRELPFFKEHGWLIGIVVPESDFIAPLIRTNLIGVLICLIILAIGIILMSRLVNKIVQPLRRVVYETEQIKRFKLEDTGRIHSRIKEISMLSDAIYNMKQGLYSFQKYVPANLVRQLIKSGKDVLIGGEKKQLAIFFSDIQDFTTISEQIDPKHLMEHICEYFNELSHIIRDTRGTIDKYIGDSIMAFWGAPLPDKKPAYQAALAALRCFERLSILNTKWIRQNKPALQTRIALHFGEAIVGNLGSNDRLNYTAVGDVINTTSRLEKINKIYNTKILVSHAFYQEIKDQFVLRMIDCVMIRGKRQNTYIYELLGQDINQIHFNLNEYQKIFEKGFDAYQNQQWDIAIQHFNYCLHIYPTDTIAPIFIKRCQEFKITPPPPDWNGVWKIQDKTN